MPKSLHYETPLIIRMVNIYGQPLVVLFSVLFMLVLLLPLLILGDYIVHGRIIVHSILSGLINAAIIAPVFIYAFLRILNELNIAKEKLSYLVVRDDLTGVYNRRYMEQRLEEAFAFSKRHNTSFGILLLDLDHFKSINDNYSHMAGDTVIKEVANLCSNMLRESDIFARYGGEEFACLVQNVYKTDIRKLAHRINKAVEAAEITFNGQSVPVTVSIGVAKLETYHASTQDILLSADKALYKAKQIGRNTVIFS